MAKPSILLFLVWALFGASKRLVDQDSGGGGKVVTIGDSYSSGTGIHSAGWSYDERYGGEVEHLGKTYVFTDHEKRYCWREEDTTPGPRYASKMGMQSIFLACKGAKISNIAQQFAYLLEKYARETERKWEDSVILLTASANDGRNKEGKPWEEIVQQCILDASSCRDDKNLPVNFPEIQEELVDFFKAMASQASKARIRVLGYPRLMLPSRWGCPTVPSISKHEARWIDRQIDALNVNIAEAVSRARTYFADQGEPVDLLWVNVTSSVKKGVCTSQWFGGAQINNLVYSRDGGISSASFHPNQRGFDAFYRALIKSL